MPEIHQNDKNYIVACYAASLTTAETLLCKSVRTNTIRRYLDALSELFVRANFQDPQKNLYGERSPYIEAVLKEHTRWEQVPNRREPLTYPMVDSVYKEVMNDMLENPTYVPDNLTECVTDWLILGMQVGMRLSEWCQDRARYHQSKDILRNVDGSPKAFVLTDFAFSNKSNVRRNNNKTVYIKDAENVTITWRFQKNNDNGQKLTFTKNNTLPHRCPVRAALRIRARCQRYSIPDDHPIAIFRDKNGMVKLIDNKHVENILKTLAQKTYNITDESELKRFTTHSIRVGACVVLHENNSSGEFIKLRLRWRSDAFLVYLRNTIKLAELHNEASNNSK